MRIDNEAEQLSIYDLDLWCGRMFQEPSPAEPQKERISGSSSRRSSELKSVVFQSLDLTPGAGNLLGEFYWELISPWRGDALTLNTGVSPREEKESSLSQILQDDPPDKYYLTRKACLGILRRAFERGKELPRKLNQALEIQSGVAPPADSVHNQQPPHTDQKDGSIEGFDGYNGDLTGAVAATLGVNCGMSTGRYGLIQPIAFAANQRDEVRDLHDVAGALGAQPGMKQQTFIAEGVVAKGNGDCFLTPERHTSLSAGGGQAGQGYPCVLTAGFSAGAGASAGSIGYGEELAPALKGSASGNCMPSILCLNDQGGSVMECSLDITGTLRAQEHGHQPLVFDNHGQDTRFCGPVKSTQTVSATFGMGGNNQPLVVDENSSSDDPPPLALELPAWNNAPPAQQETVFCITGNAIDRQPQNGGNGIGYQEGIAYTLTATDHHAVFSRQRVDIFKDGEVTSTQSARQHKDATDLVLQGTDHPRLIRRLTPLECERLQGFPDGWTDIPNASDSSRYKALGNSVAIPCVDYVLQGHCAGASHRLSRACCLCFVCSLLLRWVL